MLRYYLRTDSDGRRCWAYYRKGRGVTKKLTEAQQFTLRDAKNAKQYAQGASLAQHCEVKRVTQKMLFMAALEGR